MKISTQQLKLNSYSLLTLFFIFMSPPTYSANKAVTLATPLKPTASDNIFTNKVSISWKQVKGAITYKIFRCTTTTTRKCGKGFKDTLSPFNDTTVKPGITYYYRLKACTALACSNFSPADAGKRKQLPPAQPSKPNATNGTFGDKVQVTWKKVNSATSYKVFRCTGNTNNTCNSGFTDNVSPYSDTSAVPGTKYYYRLKACNNGGCSDFSSPVYGKRKLLPPALPTAPKASNGSIANEIKVTWNSISSTAYYELYRCTNNNNINTCNNPFKINSPTLNFNDKGTTENTAYYYRIKACNSAGCSDFGPSDKGWEMIPPNSPTSIRASDGTYTDKIRIQWHNPRSIPRIPVAQYKVSRCVSNSINSCSHLRNVSGTSWYDRSGRAGRNYYYRVKACNNAGCSDFSAADVGRIAN